MAVLAWTWGDLGYLMVPHEHVQPGKVLCHLHARQEIVNPRKRKRIILRERVEDSVIHAESQGFLLFDYCHDRRSPRTVRGNNNPESDQSLLFLSHLPHQKWFASLCLFQVMGFNCVKTAFPDMGPAQIILGIGEHGRKFRNQATNLLVDSRKNAFRERRFSLQIAKPIHCVHRIQILPIPRLRDTSWRLVWHQQQSLGQNIVALLTGYRVLHSYHITIISIG